MAECSNCPGGEATVYRSNPDPDAVEPARQENVVLIPQRLDPSRVGIDELLGMREIVGLLDGRDYVLRWDDTRTFDGNGNQTGGDCGFTVTEPAACSESMYDPGEMPEPPITGTERDGTYAISTASNCATHVFCGGRWLCLQGQTAGATNERICYPDLSGQSYGGNVGSWLVFGENQMERFPCPPEIQAWCVDEVEISATPSADLSPAGGWAGVTWINDPANLPNGVNTSESCSAQIINSSTADHRFRLEFFTPPGNRCPLELSWESFQSAEYFVGAWDSATNSLLAPTVLSDGAGSARLVTTDTGMMVGVQSAINTSFRVRYDCDQSVDAERVRIIVAGTGRETSPPFDFGKQLSALRLDSVQPSNGCFEWSSLEAQAAWMNQADPLGPGWLVLNGEVCKVVPPGQAAAYGVLAGSQSSVSPTVTDLTF